jgi:hypothetical protein
MLERLIDHSDDHNLRPQITYAGLEQSIAFILKSEGEARSIAVAAMDTIYPNASIREEIAGLDLTEGRGRFSWRHYGGVALKTSLDFGNEKGYWRVSVRKIYSEDTSLRKSIEKEVGQSSLPAYASISLGFATPEEGEKYMRTIGVKPDLESASQKAQDQAYHGLSIMLRDIVAWHGSGVELKAGRRVNRAEDMTDVIVKFAEQSDRELQGRILERLLPNKDKPYRRGSYDDALFEHKGSRKVADAMQDETFDPMAALRTLFTQREADYKSDRLQPGQIIMGNLDMLDIMYRNVANTTAEKTLLYDCLFAKIKQRIANDGHHLPTQLVFGDDQKQGQLHWPYELDASLIVPINNERVVAGLTAYYKGIFDLESRVFTPSSSPQKFALTVHASEPHRDVPDKKTQMLINTTASVLALQEPDFLSKRVGAADDQSHFWAMDTLGQTLIATDDPELQQKGGILLDNRFGTETLYG